ncbi:extracellular solute-binding protein [Oceanobacillus kimchii]|uniref:ABC transporter substrate-binding protein n=1 Tax=Oceanobacillus kimchii TaxID=746691 RepID=UPI00034543C6|nr:extracellular solute-binding protein [Oceanobacillus kimchii]MCT1578231.1 extracellular solute-binding protein [Oceanobacillus kimchii]MCT2134409.1 extracellular solute-binding protein [Oceanobacillus kimchii]
MKKILVVCLVLGLPLFLLTACADGGDSGDGDNDGGDSITLYSPETPDLTKQLAQKYEEVHGDKVNVHYAGTNVLVNQMMAEKGNPQADVWYGGGGILPFESAVDKEIITSYIPESAEDWEVIENGIKMKHQDGYYTGVELFVLGFSYNTDLVSEEEAPKTWEDLLDPKWEGKIQFPNPAASGTSTLMVLSYMMQYGEEEGWEYFQKLKDQANSIPDSGSAPTKAVAMGEAHVAVGFDFMAYEHQANGETVDFVVPDKTPILSNPMTLVKDGPNPEGGQKFMEFMLSEDAQQILADWYHIPINPDIESKTPLSVDNISNHAVELDIDWVNENYDRIRNEWNSKIK